MNIYLLDPMGCFAGTATADPYGPLPPCTLTPPPALQPGQVAQWAGMAWCVLSQYPEPAPPSPQDTAAQLAAAAQQQLDAFARARRYDSMLSLCTYTNSSVPQYRQEAEHAMALRDQTWATLHRILADVEAGTRPAPAQFADIAPELPALVWPEALAPATGV